jgi:Lar family restriction alleviation protein
MATIDGALPCPFCGSLDLDIDDWTAGPDKIRGWEVFCLRCHAGGPDHGTIPDEAVAAWNRRLPVPDRIAPAPRQAGRAGPTGLLGSVIGGSPGSGAGAGAGAAAGVTTPAGIGE